LSAKKLQQKEWAGHGSPVWNEGNVVTRKETPTKGVSIGKKNRVADLGKKEEQRAENGSPVWNEDGYGFWWARGVCGSRLRVKSAASCPAEELNPNAIEKKTRCPKKAKLLWCMGETNTKRALASPIEGDEDKVLRRFMAYQVLPWDVGAKSHPLISKNVRRPCAKPKQRRRVDGGARVEYHNI